MFDDMSSVLWYCWFSRKIAQHSHFRDGYLGLVSTSLD
jgi:hypothetical protein